MVWGWQGGAEDLGEVGGGEKCDQNIMFENIFSIKRAQKRDNSFQKVIHTKKIYPSQITTKDTGIDFSLGQ